MTEKIFKIVSVPEMEALGVSMPYDSPAGWK
jgi:hypothetical protein